METQKTLKILFIGPESIGLLIGEEAYEHGQHLVENVSSPEQAKKLLSDKSHPFNLLITGNRIEGENDAGVDLVRWAKENCPDLQIVLMSVFPNNEAKALSAGADAFWNTSCFVSELMQLIDGLKEKGHGS